MGQKAKYSPGADVFRFGLESGLNSDITACPKSANRRKSIGSRDIIVPVVGGFDVPVF
jgi:hypothetical protein